MAQVVDLRDADTGQHLTQKQAQSAYYEENYIAIDAYDETGAKVDPQDYLFSPALLSWIEGKSPAPWDAEKSTEAGMSPWLWGAVAVAAWYWLKRGSRKARR